MAGIIVGIFVTVRISQLLHQLGGGVAQMEGHRQVARPAHKSQGFVDGKVGRIALGAGGQVDGAFGQGDAPFGPTYLHHGIEGGIGQQEGVGVGQAYILCRADDQTTGDKGGVFPTLHHTGQPIDGSVGI